jgi:hypothetical protein
VETPASAWCSALERRVSWGAGRPGAIPRPGGATSVRYAGASTRSAALLGGCPRNSTQARFAQG